VTRLVRAMTSPGTLTLRLRLNRPATKDGVRTRVTVATSESLRAENRPVLVVRSRHVAAAGRPPTTSTSTAPPAPTPTTRPAPPPITTPAPATPPAGQIFGDEFNGSTLDLSKWRPNWLAGTDDAITKPVNSAELSCYDPAQVSVSGGYLHLRAVNRACAANNGVSYAYASGLVESAHDFTFTHGRVEARVWLPGTGSVANWPAFWTNGTGTWPVTGELDVMEGLEGHACWHFHSTAGGPGGCAPMANPTGWHTFAADWRAGSVTYFYDGVQVGRIASGITSSPMYLVFNLAVSTQIAPPVQLPSEMLVDWVRVTP
jgi:beta-glucanase (GH16 family)